MDNVRGLDGMMAQSILKNNGPVQEVTQDRPIKFSAIPRRLSLERKLQRQLNLPRIACGGEAAELRGSENRRSVSVLRS